MVDVVARVVVEDDGARTLNFKSNEVVFGGGRLTNITETTIPLDWDELMNVFGGTPKQEAKPVEVKEEAPQEEEKPKRKSRKARA